MAREGFYVIYRTGGTENYSWHRSVRMDRAHAEQVNRDMVRMGYRSLIERADRSDTVGLPETFEARGERCN